jgi:hypothetical protein
MLAKLNPDFWQAWVLLWQAIVTALLFWIKDRIDNWRSKRSRPHHPLKETTEQNERQTEILSRLREEFHPSAMRAYLSKFHNGDQYVDGSDILRKSRVAEVVREGVSHEANRFKAVLISTISDEMKFMDDEGPGWFVVGKLRLSNFRQMMEETGAVAGARQKVSKAGKPVGFIGMDFDTTEPPPNLKEKLAEYAGWIEETL